MIYIAKDVDGKVMSVISAINERIAMAYWTGKNIYPHNISCLEKDFGDPETTPSGVYPIINIQEITGYELVEYIERNLDRRSHKFYVTGL